MTTFRVCAWLLILMCATARAQETPRDLMNRAVEHFRAGRIEQAVALFDRVATLSPDEAPYLWQRGIAQYYAGRFRECRDMFVSHRTVNPADVENTVWHFLCVARAESPDAARKQMLPVGPDSRVPMAEVHQMFLGRATTSQVLARAGQDPSSQFFARLYVGLYLEATGDRTRGREHIAIAAADRYASVGGYMHDVARVHMMGRK